MGIPTPTYRRALLDYPPPSSSLWCFVGYTSKQVLFQLHRCPSCTMAGSRDTRRIVSVGENLSWTLWCGREGLKPALQAPGCQKGCLQAGSTSGILSNLDIGGYTPSSQMGKTVQSAETKATGEMGLKSRPWVGSIASFLEKQL